MILALGFVAVISGTITFYLLRQKQQKEKINYDYASKVYDYKGVRPIDFIKNRVMFYPYNYVNG